MNKSLAACVAAVGIMLSGPVLAQSVTLRLGHAVFEAHPYHDAAVRFKEAVERLSGGDIAIQVFPARQLGDVKELMEGVQFGTVDITVNSSSALASMEPAIDAFQLPGVIPGYEGFAKLAVSPEAQAIMDTLDKHGILGLGLYDGGQRHFLSIGAPVETLEGFRGLKTRVAPSRLFLDTWQAAGVNPTPMAYGEVYSALETGALDAVEINLTSIESEKYYEVAGGVTLTGHYFWPGLLLVNKRRFDGLSAEQQQVLRDAAAEITEAQVMAVSALDSQVVEKLRGLNIPVIEPSAEFLEGFAAAVKPVVDTYRAADPLVQDFVNAADALR